MTSAALRAKVFVAVVLGASLWQTLSSQRRLAPFHDSTLIGESLLHGIGQEGVNVSMRMPAATVLPALFFDHWGWPRRLSTLAALLEAALVLVLCAQLGLSAPGCALAVLLLLPLSRANVYADAMDPLYSLYLLLVAALLVRRAQTPTLWRTLCLALALGASLLYRSPLAFLPPLLAWREWRAGGPPAFRKRWQHILLLGLLPYLFLLPWIRMNWIATRRFIPLEHRSAELNMMAAALGVDDCLELATERSELLDHPPVVFGESLLPSALIETAAHPLRYLLGVFRRLTRAAAMHPWLLFLALTGIWRQRRRRDVLTLAQLPLYFALIYCAMATQERYFDPLWPLLAVLGALAWPRPAGAAAAAPGWPSRVCATFLALGLVLALSASAATIHIVNRYAAAARMRPPTSPQALELALRDFPGEAWLSAMNGLRLLAAGDASEAAAELNQASAAAGAARWPGLETRLLWARDLAGESPALLDASLDEKLYDAFELRLFQAAAWLRRGRREEARKALSLALKSHNRRLVVNGEKTARNIALFKRLRTYDDGFAQDSYRLIKHRPAAEQAALFAEIARLLPGASRAWILRANALVELGRYQEALAALNCADATSPGNGDLAQMRPLAFLKNLGLTPPPAEQCGENDPSVLAWALENGIRASGRP